MLVGGTPMDRTGGNPMRASSAAMTMSQCRARSVPPARQLPWTWAMTGMRQSQTFGPCRRPARAWRPRRPRCPPGPTAVAGFDVVGQDPVARGERAPRAADDDRHGRPGRLRRRPPAARISRMQRGVSGLCRSRPVEGEPAHRADPLGDDGRLPGWSDRPASSPIGWIAVGRRQRVRGCPGSSSRITTLPAALRGKASTRCSVRGTL